MSESMYIPVVDGYSGFPIESDAHRSSSGSVEWLLGAVERHAIAEQDALELYEYLRTASGDPVIGLVMRLILEDEERHHGLLKRIEATLRDAIEWTHSPAALPTPATPTQPVRQALIDTASALIKEEHTGAHYLRDLAHREKAVNSGLTSLLIEMMAMDSDKHARLLQFVRDRLASRPRDEDGPRD
jgi:rubrerythrin